MYIWVGIDVDGQLSPIKERAKTVERAIGFVNSNFTLPLHISLKISFRVEEALADRVMEDILLLYREVTPFSLPVKGLENEDTIAWIRMGESEELNLLHDRLNEMLLTRYRIPLHEYDTDYKFHTTLFMDNDTKKVKRAYDAVKDTPPPHSLQVKRLIIGTSPTGALGSYHVVKAHEI